MNRVEAIAARRAQLIARAEADRARVASDFAPLAGAIAVVDKGWAAARWLRERPLAVALAGVALAAVAGRRPRGALRWARLAFSAWQGWRLMSRAQHGRKQ
jgi:hypothetical protein